MTIIGKVRAVERMFGRLEKEITKFKYQSGLHCVAGCGKCCTKTNIEASPLEFLPLSFHLFSNGRAQEVLDRLNQETSTVCMIYAPLSVVDQVNGSCSEYAYRGLICRLFGYGAGRDKLGQLRLATCKIIKEGQDERYQHTVEAINHGLPVPVFTDYYMQLSQIDFRLGNMILPINEALKMAIEEVLHYYTYRPLPRGVKGAA